MSLTKASTAKSPAAPAPAPAAASLRASGAESPHTLPRYKEPKPFITARSFKSFSVAAAIACGGSWALYRIMARRVDSLDAAQEAAADALSGATAATENVKPRSSDTESLPAVPTFAAPTSFAQLAELTSNDRMGIARKTSDTTAPKPPLLHEEAAARARTMWNDALDALESSVVALERQHREYREGCAAAGVRTHIEALYPDAECKIQRA